MKYKAKSALIGREGARDDEGRAPVFVELFNINDPHKTTEMPNKRLDFVRIGNIIISGLKIEYLLGGSDILINDLEEIEVDLEEGDSEHLLITGKQK